MQLIYRGSVKDLYKKDQNIVFEYSNRYSIFDWGEMPNEIPLKGEALAAMARMFFSYLKAKGIDSHYINEVNRSAIEVKAVSILRPEWTGQNYDYSDYAHRPTHCLVPLEVIFRRHLGQGNSLEGRLKKNPAYLKDLGLTDVPTDKDSFHPALIEVSTKLETTDRYLSKSEILQMNVISEDELHDIRNNTRAIVNELESLFASFGVKLWDGKVEFAFGENQNGKRSLLLVDSIGPDELRLTYQGMPLSKEFLRQIYSNTSWAEAVKNAKDLAKERKTQDWKRICAEELEEVPESLSAEQIAVSSLLYQSLANEIATATGHELPFSEHLNLKLWHEKAQALLGRQ